MEQIFEDVGLEALFPESSVQALDVRVLDWFSRLDEQQAHFFLVGPLVECFACELGSVVDGGGLRYSACCSEFFQDPHDAHDL